MEAEFTVQLCEFIVQTSKLVPEKIGIIAPYQKQKSILLGYLKDKWVILWYFLFMFGNPRNANKNY